MVARVAASCAGTQGIRDVSLAFSFLGSCSPIPTRALCKSTGRWLSMCMVGARSCMVAAKGMKVHPVWHSLLHSGLKYGA